MRDEDGKIDNTSWKFSLVVYENEIPKIKAEKLEYITGMSFVCWC
jgi:hypothetical protein